MNFQVPKIGWRRRRLLIDARIQVTLFCFALFLSLAWLIAGVLIYMLITSAPAASFGTFGISAVCLILNFAATIYVGLLITNRIAGPIHRIRSEMRKVSDGGPLVELVPRDDDMVGDLFIQYNRLLKRFER